jgi:hypothetical protein
VIGITSFNIDNFQDPIFSLIIIDRGVAEEVNIKMAVRENFKRARDRGFG